MTSLALLRSHPALPPHSNPFSDDYKPMPPPPPPPPKTKAELEAEAVAALAEVKAAIKAAAAAEEGRGEWTRANPNTPGRHPADVARGRAVSAMRKAQALDPEVVAKIVKDVTTSTPTAEVRAILVLLSTIDSVVMDRMREAWASAGIVAKRRSQEWIKESAQHAAREEAETYNPVETEFSARDVLLIGHRALVQHAVTCLAEANRRKPTLFWQGDRFAEVRRDAEGVARIVGVDGPQGMGAVLNRWGLFVRKRGEGKAAQFVNVPAPVDVSRDVWHHPDPLTFALPLAGIRNAPFFDARGDLVATDAYHPGSRIVLAMKPELREAVGRVSAPGWSPTAEEAEAALLLIATECALDFPLDGRSRAESAEAIRTKKPVPSLAALIGLLVLPFMRELVDGPTPGHLICKPSPGTGASLLADLVSIIVTGEDASALTFPRTAEEVGKTLASIMREGAELAYFDNLASAVEGAEMASALTARRYKARLLGSTATLDVPVRAVFILTGNMVTASGEIARRLTPIILDARSPDPTTRTGWRHADLLDWTRGHRGEVVVAILTLIRRWIVMDRPAPSCAPLASYESWTRVVGGVVEHAAGLAGFLEGREAWKAEAVEADGVERLVTALALAGDGATIRVRPRKASDGHVSLLDTLQILGDATDTEDPLALKGWGFEPDPGRDGTSYRYGKGAVVGKQFGKASRRPWAVKVEGQDVVVSFTEHVASDNSKSWAMTIKAATG